MCHERWARARDEAVASSYLRGLSRREREDEPVAEHPEPVADEQLVAADAVAVGER
jgi:hypothetical protein